MDQRELTEKYVPNDDIYLFNTGGARMAYLTFGCRYIPGCDMHTLDRVFPQRARGLGRRRLQRLGRLRQSMYRREDGVWCAFIPGVKQGDIYKYRVVDQGGNAVLKADPFAFHAETGPATGSKVWDIEGWIGRTANTSPRAQSATRCARRCPSMSCTSAPGA